MVLGLGNHLLQLLHFCSGGELSYMSGWGISSLPWVCMENVTLHLPCLLCKVIDFKCFIDFKLILNGDAG